MARTREIVRQAWQRLRGGELTRARAALSTAVGVFVGSLPLYGFHFWICLAVTWPLRLDFPLAYVAANLSNPLVAPFLVAAEIEVGSLVRTGQTVHISAAQIRAEGWSGAFIDAVVGSVIVGGVLAALGGAAAWLIVRDRPNADALADAIRRTTSRFASSGRFVQGYVRSKLAHDPAMRMIAEHEEPLGQVLDLGCGRGQLALLLLEAGRATSVHAVDWDGAKVGYGRMASANDAAVTFETADVRNVTLREVDTILMVDVLHYLTKGEQDDLLRRAVTFLRPGGRLIVREADGERGVRAFATRFAEIIATRTNYNRGRTIAMRPIREIVEILEGGGLACETARSSASAFSNVLVVARRLAP